MNREYGLVTPSLDGIICHESIEYEGLRRPPEINRIFDRPKRLIESPENRKMIEQYFHDLYEVFIKKISQFIVEAEPLSKESVKLMAMLQELIKIKKLLAAAKQIT
jgi:hypothetical protein